MDKLQLPAYLTKEFPELRAHIEGLHYLKIFLYMNGATRTISLRRDTLEAVEPRIQKWLIKKVQEEFGVIKPPVAPPDEEESSAPSEDQDDAAPQTASIARS